MTLRQWSHRILLNQIAIDCSRIAVGEGLTPWWIILQLYLSTLHRPQDCMLMLEDLTYDGVCCRPGLRARLWYLVPHRDKTFLFLEGRTWVFRQSFERSLTADKRASSPIRRKSGTSAGGLPGHSRRPTLRTLPLSWWSVGQIWTLCWCSLILPKQT